MKDKILSVIGGSWWSLPESVKDKLKTMISGETTWYIKPYKCEDYPGEGEGSGCWSFDIPWLLTWGEKLLGGTDKCLDYWYKEMTGKSPVKGDKFKMMVSSVKEQIESPTMTLKFMYPDEHSSGSSYYYDPISKIDCWLCPYLQFLFGESPKTLYVKLIPDV